MSRGASKLRREGRRSTGYDEAALDAPPWDACPHCRGKSFDEMMALTAEMSVGHIEKVAAAVWTKIRRTHSEGSMSP